MNDYFQLWSKSPFQSIKFDAYFSIYEELFGHLRGERITFVEIGIQGGGSLFAWRDYFGIYSRIIGIDLNPDCLALQDYGFEIFIGDAADSNFLTETFLKIGNIDGILDDGGHVYHQQINVLQQAALIPSKNLIVAIEDTSTSYYKDFLNISHKKTFIDYSKGLTDLLHNEFKESQPERFKKKYIFNKKILKNYENLIAINFYKGIVAFKFSNLAPGKITLISNESSNLIGKGDFRYNGRPNLKILWPHQYKDKSYLVGISKIKYFLVLYRRFINNLLQIKR